MVKCACIAMPTTYPKVGLVMKDSLKPKIGQQILREAIPV